MRNLPIDAWSATRLRTMLLLAVTLTSATGCMPDYVRRTTEAAAPRDVTVAPGDGRKHDFFAGIDGDFARLQPIMGNPSAYREIYFNTYGLHVEVFPDGAKHRIAKWSINDDGAIHRSVDEPTTIFDCEDRQPFAIDEAIISRLPHSIEDAPRHTSGLDNPRLALVSIQRGFGVFRCGDVEIDVNFDADCSEIYENDDGDMVYDCPSGDVVYDTMGRLIRSTIDHHERPADD